MTDPTSADRSPLRVIIHSFFVVPLLIAAMGVLFFFIWKLLTYEPRTAHDYLADIKGGGETKRWQSAYELSRVIAASGPEQLDERFTREMLATYEYAKWDPNWRVRQYLIRAMGQTRDESYAPALVETLTDPTEEIVADAVYALGLIGAAESRPAVTALAENPSALVRNRVAIALGTLGAEDREATLTQLLGDSEPNVQWSAALSLAQKGNSAGKEILLQLLDRDYLESFERIDPVERSRALRLAIAAGAGLGDKDLERAIAQLGREDEEMAVRDAAMKALQL